MEFGWRTIAMTALFLTLTTLIAFYKAIYHSGSAQTNSVEAFHVKSVVGAQSSELCTFALFREACKHRDYFPGGGEWLVTDGVAHFQPTICKYRYPRVPDAFMRRCLSKANISYVLTMGDSTGGRYASALEGISTLNCQILLSENLKEDGFLPDKEYFTRRMTEEVARFVTEKFRFCRGCASWLNRCDFSYNNESYSLELEHIAQTMILDDSLQVTYPSYKDAAHILGKVWALTTQELVLRYYLADKKPDLILIFLPFVHAKHNMRMSRLSMEIEYFKKLVEEYLPNTTKLVYFTSYGEFEEARNDSDWHGVLFEGMLAREKIDRMNHVLYGLLEEDLLKPGGQYLGFFDLIDVSKDRGRWSTDSVHMEAVWYESIMSMFWETYCNSVLLDMF